MSTAPVATAQVVLKPKKSGPFFARHPWVLDASIDRVAGPVADGEVVDLVTHKGEFVARGVYNAASRIQVRLYSWDAEQPLDETFWRERIAAALALREQLGYTDDADAARLIFSEADGLSGLIVDRYGRDLVVQITANAIAVRIEQIVPILVELANPRSITLRSDANLAKTEGVEPQDRVVHGQPPESVTIRQHDVDFHVDFREGQKTGFYLDQRDNRRVAASFVAGRRVLDMCCYTGGFGITAAKIGGAREVHAVDTSAKMIDLARANAALNNLDNITFEVGDCFDVLERLSTEGKRYDTIVLDPPKFAGSRGAVERALNAYHRLNRLAVEVLAPGGYLITCSCSAHVVREDFQAMLAGVAQRTRRDIQFIEQRGPSSDHPVSATCPETEYLKCFICRVM
jgi:23S rRNA (cytosine1962-C5)-methyltransferase